MSMKNSDDTIANQFCDRPACSSVPQLTTPLRQDSILLQIMSRGFVNGVPLAVLLKSV
jgi:hypothetical protein